MYTFSAYWPYYKRNLKVAFPVMLTQFGAALVGLADSIMVGHYSTADLAAVSAADLARRTASAPYIGETVAVIGGGLTGCEIAYELALQGRDVKIVEMKDDLISQKGVCLANSSYLREWFAWKQVPVYLESTLKEVRDGSIVCTGKDGRDFEISCDSVISSAGYVPAPLAQKSRNVYLVGDCDAVGNLRTVVWQAYETAMKI